MQNSGGADPPVPADASDCGWPVDVRQERRGKFLDQRYPLRLAVRFAPPRRLHARGQFGNRRTGKQGSHRQVDAGRLADPGHQPHGRQRAAAQREEIIVHADAFELQQFGLHGGQFASPTARTAGPRIAVLAGWHWHAVGWHWRPASAPAG